MTSSCNRKKLLCNLLKYKAFFPTVSVIVSVSYFYSLIKISNLFSVKKLIKLCSKDKIMKLLFTLVTIFLACLVLSGCMTPAQHYQSLPSTQERELTVGIVQKEIKVGMSQADVVSALGSPNIVTRDSEGKETWVYDKVSTEYFYSKDVGGIGGGAGGGGTPGTSLILGLFGGSYQRSAGAYSQTQKTLTIIIKFDKNQKVESFSYHASKF